MNRLVVDAAVLMLALPTSCPAVDILCGRVAATVDEKTGCIAGMRSASGTGFSRGFETRYLAMSRGGDVEAFEREDRVTETTATDDGSREFRCVSPKLPGVTIVKRYEVVNGGLQRTLTFCGDSTNETTVYVTPFTKCIFEDGFKKGLWHLGAGYIGPYRPFPDVATPTAVNQYKQSSKGLVFTHPGGGATGFAHYRVMIDDTVVLPWFHSTIGHYREYHDRLWYLPDGYEMGLGTFDVRPGKAVSVTDRFAAFDGELFGFFDGVFGVDPDVRREMDSIPSSPEWIHNLACIFWNTINDDFVRWMADMMDESEFVAAACLFNSWGDYRFDPDTGLLQGNFGGSLTRDETAAYYDRLRTISDRVHPTCYEIVISAGKWTRILKERPGWFRMRDRDGNDDSLFPNFCQNYQTKFCNPDCRGWMVDMLSSFAGTTGSDVTYTDEAQMTNTIDWDTDEVTRDDDCVKFWRALKRRLHDRGIMYFANGSGLPYADLNYMESPHEMQPKRWRDWVGVALGIGMLNRMKPGNRTSPLYWTPGCDYVNRFLALGWVPVPTAGKGCLMPIRAGWQCGHMTPIDARCSPDWKRDFATEIESHACVRRGCDDVVLSFINRGKEADVPISMDLSSLGFGPNARVNVWKGHFDASRAERGPILSDRELRANWRGEGATDGASLYSPELVYSGLAAGTFADVISHLGQDRMEQYLVTSAPIQLFAANDVPLNQYFTTAKGCRIDGNVVKCSKRVDVLLASLDHGFSDVTVNGAPAVCRRIRLGGRVFDMITLEPGEWKMAWKEASEPGKDAAADLPASQKARVSDVPPIKSVVEPEMRETFSCAKCVKSVEVGEAYRWTTACVTKTGIQPGMKPGVADIDAETLRMTVGASRREAANTTTLRCWAGFKLRGARRLKLRFSHTLQDAHSSHRRYTYPWGWGKPQELFAGLLVDYHTPTGYAGRVSMSTGLFSDRCVAVFPWWGAAKGAKESLNLSFGEWIESAEPREFVLDIAKFAPQGWDGECILSLGEEKLGAGRRLSLEILGFNEDADGEEAVPRAVENIRDMPPPVASKPLKSKPRSLSRLYREEWDRWAKLPGKFTRLVSGAAKKGTQVFMAHDYEFMYVGVQCEEGARPASAQSSAPHQNEHVEVCFHRGDGKVIQYIGDVKGRVLCFLDKVEMPLPAGTVCRGEECNAWKAGWRVFFAIPLDSLKVDMQRTPVTVRANVCRERKIDDAELTSWAPMEKNGFYDLPKYGTWILDFNW